MTWTLLKGVRVRFGIRPGGGIVHVRVDWNPALAPSPDVSRGDFQFERMWPPGGPVSQSTVLTKPVFDTGCDFFPSSLRLKGRAESTQT